MSQVFWFRGREGHSYFIDRDELSKLRDLPKQYLPIGITRAVYLFIISIMGIDDDFVREKFLMKLGKQIAKVRRSKGYSQDRLALESGLARGTMSKIEAGMRDPRASTLYKIADVLEVPISGFFDSKKR